MNKLINISKKTANILGSLSLFFVGALILVITILSLKNYKEYDTSTEAVITKIEQTDQRLQDDGTYEYSYQVYVSYEVGEQTYNDIEYSSYDSSMKVGDKITITYNEENPSEIGDPNGKTMIYIFLGISSAAILGAIIWFVKTLI